MSNIQHPTRILYYKVVSLKKTNQLIHVIYNLVFSKAITLRKRLHHRIVKQMFKLFS